MADPAQVLFVPRKGSRRPATAYVIRRKNNVTGKEFVGIYSEPHPEIIGRHWHDELLFTAEDRDFHDADKKAAKECQKRGLKVNQ